MGREIAWRTTSQPSRLPSSRPQGSMGVRPCFSFRDGMPAQKCMEACGTVYLVYKSAVYLCLPYVLACR